MSHQLISKLLVSMCLVYPAVAQNKSPEPENANIRKSVKAETSPKAAALSFSNWEVYKNFSVPANQSIDIDSGIDFSSSDLATVTVRAATGSPDLSNMVVLAYWTFSNADFFSVAETANGANFVFSNVGGAVFNVYGTQFRLRLQNNGNSTVVLSQVTIRCRSL